MGDDARKSDANADGATGEPPGLSVDDRSPAFGIARAATPTSAGSTGKGANVGIRSPLAQVSGAAGTSGGRSGTGKGALREISQIKGLSQPSHQLPPDAASTHISHVMYDAAPARRRRTVVALVILALLAGGAYVYSTPPLKRQFVRQYKRVYATVLDFVDPSRKKKRKPSRIKTHTAATRFPTSLTPGAGGRLRNCAQLVIEDAGGGRLSLGERVDLAECHLLQGDLVAAEGALKPAARRIGAATEAEINRAPASRSIADAYQVLVGTYLREGKSQEATKVLRSKCRKWEQTNTCVAKAMMLADRRLSAAGIETMFANEGKLGRKAQARLWLAGAQIALAEDRPTVTDRRYGLALEAAPKSALALRKTIYEAQAVDLFHRGDVPRLKTTVERALAELRPLGSEGKMKLTMLVDLATAPDRTRRAREMLTREEFTFRVRRDFDLIEILGPESLRSGLETDYLRLLKRTRDFYDDRYRATDPVARKLAVWELRAKLSAGDHEGALVLSHTYDRNYGADAFSLHMRGVAYHLASSHERYQFLAAQEFQGALRKQRGWESLYALGIALTRSGRKELVAPVIKDLDAAAATKGQRFWADMLKAEWYLAQGKVPNAEQVLTGWIQERPRYFTPHQLLIKVLGHAGRTGDQARAEQALAELSRSARFHGSQEALASPLGPMALGKRPLE